MQNDKRIDTEPEMNTMANREQRSNVVFQERNANNMSRKQSNTEYWKAGAEQDAKRKKILRQTEKATKTFNKTQRQKYGTKVM